MLCHILRDQEHRSLYVDILNEEKALDIARKSLRTAQRKTRKHDKTFEGLQKKGKNTASAQLQLRQITSIQEICAAEVESTWVVSNLLTLTPILLTLVLDLRS